MSGKHEDWTPREKALAETFKIPELHVLSISYKRGMEKFPTQGPGGPVFRLLPDEDDLTVRLVGVKGKEATINLKGRQVDPFIQLITQHLETKNGQPVGT